MIDLVIDRLVRIRDHRFVFCCLKSHVDEFGLDEHLRRHVANALIVTTDVVTRGPLETALLAAPHIDTSDEVFVAYCDGFMDIDLNAALEGFRAATADGGLFLFPSKGVMNSYATVDPNGRVTRVAEKQVISAEATFGQYYFRQGSRFLSLARATLADADPQGPEVFVSVVYNRLIAEGGLVLARRFDRNARVEMGTPDDLARLRAHLAADLAPAAT